MSSKTVSVGLILVTKSGLRDILGGPEGGRGGGGYF